MNDHVNMLVSGAASGLGRHCCEKFNATAYTRQTNYNALMEMAQSKPFDVIIHSAFNTKPNMDSSQLYEYLQDTTFLTRKLLAIPHKKFIFISTIDVYPKDNESHHEDEVINLKEITNLYALSKLMSESLVLKEESNCLVLRPSAMLGADAKPNSLIKILYHERVSLTLSGESIFNYIRHADVSDFIAQALKKDLSGIFNITSSSNIQLAEVSRHFNKPVSFGNYVYQTANADNHKAIGVLSSFKNTSMDNINLYLQDMKKVTASHVTAETI